MNSRYLLIFLSIALYTIPFFIPTLFFLMIAAPGPLMILLCDPNFTHIECSLLALLIWIIQPGAVYHAIFMLAQGPAWTRCIIPLSILIYLSSITILWFMTIKASVQFFALPHAARLALATLGLFLYFIFIDQYCLGTTGGYPFANPLIPLTEWRPLISLAAHMAPCHILALFFITTGSFTHFLTKLSLKSLCASTLACVPWIIGILNCPHQGPPAWLSRVGHISTMIIASSRPDATLALKWHLQNLRKRHPDLTLIALPESAVNKEPEWGNVPSFPALLLGTFRPCGAERTNICGYWHENCLVTHAKTHTLPLVEQSPPAWLLGSLDSFFFSSATPTKKGTITPTVISVAHIGNCIPSICSELFYAQPTHQRETVIIALCNDWWFSYGYFKRIMALTARLRAITWRTPILYISYSYAQYFDDSGKGFSIATTNPNYLIR